MLLIPLETGTNAFTARARSWSIPRRARGCSGALQSCASSQNMQGRCSGQSSVTTGSFLLDSSPCQDILLWFLEKAEREQSLAVLEGLAGLSSHVPTLHPQCQLRVGSEGGAAIVVEEAIR